MVEQILAALKKVGIDLSPAALGALGVALPVVLAAAVALVARYLKQRKDKKAAGPAVQRPQGQAAPADDIPASQLRDAYKESIAQLPGSYRRSILNLEHFLVLGGESADTRAFVDSQTDWKYQTRQVAGHDVTPNGKLPVYLASGTLVIDVPRQPYLEQSTEGSHRALEALYRPLYTNRSPTVVVVLDATWLAGCTSDKLAEHARRFREAVNQVSAIRKKALEVRVALVGLSAVRGQVSKAADQRDGFSVLSAFWAKNDISSRIAPPEKGTHAEALDAWLQGARAELPGVLASVGSSADYRAVLGFHEGIPAVLANLGPFLETLLGQEVTSLRPVAGGVYLCSSASAAEGPLRAAQESGRGPDPNRKHQIIAAAVAGACVAYMGLAFEAQHAVWGRAQAALFRYENKATGAAIEQEDPKKQLVGTGRDLDQKDREIIDEFTVRRTGPLYRFPDFHGDRRRAMRARFSGLLRGHLRAQLDRAAAGAILTVGGVGADGETKGMSLRWRRSIYLLALIHSYSADTLQIGTQPNLDVFVEMAQVRSDVILDYLENTDEPLREPMSFRLNYDNSERDERDTQKYWTWLPEKVREVIERGRVDKDELEKMKTRAADMRASFTRFAHDDQTIDLLKNIDHATDSDSEKSGTQKRMLYDTYSPQFERPLADLKSMNFHPEDDSELKRLVALVETTDLVDVRTEYLAELVDELGRLKNAYEDVPAGMSEEPIRPRIDDEGDIDPKAWMALLRDSSAAILVAQLVSPDGGSIFFDPADDDELRPVVWNALGTDGSIIRGKGVFERRTTKAAFDARVRKVVALLAQLLADMHVPAVLKSPLMSTVRRQVAQYGAEYRRVAAGFLGSFGVNASSVEELRVALGVMSSQSSTFDEFIDILDENTHLEPDDVATDGDDGGGDPKSGADKSGGSKGGDSKSGGGKSGDSKSGGDKKAGSSKSGGDKKAGGKGKAQSSPGGEDAQYMLEPIYDELREFDSWHVAVGEGGKERDTYKQIATQLLADLQGKEDAQGGKDDGNKGDAQGGNKGDAQGAKGDAPASDGAAAASSLERELTPAGRAALATIRGDKGSYDAMVKAWARKALLTADQSAPFLAPFNQLMKVGQSNIEDVIRRAWNTQIYPPVKEISAKFPFDRTSETTATPSEVTALFHPIDGKFFLLFRAYVEPISVIGNGPFRERSSARGLRVPPDLYPTANAVGALAAKLWDDKGASRRFEVRVTTVPFDNGPSRRYVPTLVHLAVGDASIHNFNQKPVTQSLAFNWTKDETAAIGLQVTDVDTKDTSYPSPLLAPGTFWRFLRLLKLASVKPAKDGEGVDQYEWLLPISDGSSDKMKARLLIAGDPFRPFTLSRAATVARASR